MLLTVTALLPLLLALASAQTNECETDNGGCEHNCHNTDISYYCSCNSGYRVKEDLHACLWLNCDYPGSLEFGNVTDTDEWWTHSYAMYKCDDEILHTLIGPEDRRCNDHDQWVEWSGFQPSCYDECMLGILHMECAPQGTDSEECKQMGCCHVATSEGCFLKEVPVYLRYGGRRPTENDGNGYDLVEYASESGCKTMCAIPGGVVCKAYGMHYKGFEESGEHEIEQKDCHFWDKSKQQYEDMGMWGDDDDFNFYDDISNTVGRGRHQGDLDIGTNADYHNAYNLLEGCFYDDPDERDLDWQLWKSSKATVQKCINDCRDWSFRHAALQNGDECWCSNNVYRIHGNASDEECGMPCTGDSNAICGGDMVNSVYFVPFDTRFIGCYEYEDYPIQLWDNTTEHSAVDCVETCLLQGYLYAATHTGGACFCKDSYGDGGEAPYEECGLACGELWGEQDCGGYNEFSVYNTKFHREMLTSDIPADVSTLYLDDSSIDGIPASIFSQNRKLKSVITPRIHLHASQLVNTPAEDMNCFDDCYEACGAIYHPDGLSNRGEDVYLRFFHINLADIEQYAGDYAERVYVFAQTVVIDRDVHLPFSVMIRARHLTINNQADVWITVDRNKELLYPSGLDNVTDFGPPPDLTFMKQSFMCSRILLDQREMDDATAAWAILHDLGHGHAFSEEHEDYMEGVRMFSATASGVYRSGAYFVPFYTKDYIAELMENYAVRIGAYNEHYKEIQSGIEDKDEFIGFVREMLRIHLEMDVWEAARSFQGSYAALERANATYHRMYELYEESRVALEEAEAEFEQCIEDALEELYKEAMKGFIKGCTKMVFGRRRGLNAKKIEQDLKKIIDGIQRLAESMELLAECMEAVEQMMAWLDYMMDRLDQILEDIRYGAYYGDIEMVATIYESIVHWENIRMNTHIIMNDPVIKSVCGAQGYHIAMIETCNWGEALSRSMLELADSLRECVMQKMYLEAKLHQVKRYDDYLTSLEEDLIEQELMLTYMLELEYDIRIDMNNMLFTYCQAFWYEHISMCNPAYYPSFGGSIDELLFKINLALEDNIWAGPDVPFPVNRPVTIVDPPDTLPNCTDHKLCPINYLRLHRLFVFDLQMGHPTYLDLDKYRVREIVMVFEGAIATGPSELMKVGIESSGPFETRYKGDVYGFVSTSLTLTYEYYIHSCDEYYNCQITIRARPYDALGDVYQHVTPYTEWIVNLSDMVSSDIDVSQVTSVTMVFDGSAINNELHEEDEIET